MNGGLAQRDYLGHSTMAIVEKFDEDQVNWVERRTGLVEPKKADFDRFGLNAYETIVDHTPNLTVTSGLGILTNCLLGVTTADFGAANLCAIGVGSGTTAAAAANTDLQTPSFYQVADSAPTRTTVNVTNDTLQIVATFGTANANVAWNEWGVIVATTGTLVSAATKAGTGTASLFNHVAPTSPALGTKASTQSWTFTVKLTWS